MQLQAKIYDPTYTTLLGDGPIPVISANFRRGLDRIGYGRATLVSAVERTWTLVTQRRICELWLMPDVADTFAARLMGAFRLDNITRAVTGRQMTYQVSGASTGVALQDYPIYKAPADNVTVSTTASAIVGEIGWSAAVETAIATSNVSGRYDRVSLQEALNVLVEAIGGAHWREHPTAAQTIQIGMFGASSGLVIDQADGITAQAVYDDDTILQIASMVYDDDGSQLVNSIIAQGAGKGDAALTLAKSTDPDVLSETQFSNGNAYYYIEDATSISTYGRVRRVIKYPQIGPVGTSEQQQINAANALAAAAKATLSRRKDPTFRINVDVLNARAAILPGDKIRVRYRGELQRPDGNYTYADIDQELWIMSSDESVGPDGVVVSLELASADTRRKTLDEIIVDGQGAITVQEIGVQSSLNAYAKGPYQRLCTAGNTTTYEFEIRDRTQDVDAVTLTVRRTAEARHDHMVSRTLDKSLNLASQRYFTPALQDFFADGTTSAETIAFIEPTYAEDAVFRTQAASDDYGADLSSQAQSLTIAVDGTEIATGVFPSASGDASATYDITAAVKAGTLRGTHTIEIAPASGYGNVAVEIDIEDQIAQITGA